MNVLYLLISALFWGACSSDPQSPVPMPDGGSDSTFWDLNSDLTEEPDVYSGPCRQSSDCPRGQRCEPPLACFGSTGCGVIWNDSVPPDIGCVFEYDGDGDPSRQAGLFSAKECDIDEDCIQSPYGPHCIRRACHMNGPCEIDDDCGEGLVCVWSIICVDSARVVPR